LLRSSAAVQLGEEYRFAPSDEKVTGHERSGLVNQFDLIEGISGLLNVALSGEAIYNDEWFHRPTIGTDANTHRTSFRMTVRGNWDRWLSVSCWNKDRHLRGVCPIGNAGLVGIEHKGSRSSLEELG
jgi:hypothetical protein